MSVREAQEKINAEEFKSWQCYFNISPFGPERLDFMIAQLTAVLVQCNTTKGNYKAADFMSFSEKKKKAQSKEDMLMLADQFAKMHNARYKK